MEFGNLVLLAQALVVVAFMTVAVFKNRTGKYTDGLLWPLENLAVFLLQRVGKEWSEKFYYSVTRITAMTAVYVVLLRERGGTIEVFLTPREDSLYQGVVHHPGSRIRASDRDASLGDAVGRVLHEEYGDAVSLGKFAGLTLTQAPSGTEISVVFLGEPLPDEELQVAGEWFDVTKLPSNLIVHEPFVDRVAVEAFRRSRSIST